MERKPYLYIPLLVMLSWSNYSSAQDAVLDFIHKIKQANAGNEMSYDYTMYLKNINTGKFVDSVGGKLYKSGNNYLDSNKNSLSAVNEGYFCKIGFDRKQAVVFSIDKMKAAAGFSGAAIKPLITEISDSLIIKYGKAKFSKLPNGNYWLEISFDTRTQTLIAMEINAGDLRVNSIRMELIERNRYGEDEGYRKICQLKNIKFKFDTRILNQQRFYVLAQNKIKMTNQYSAYHLETLTN